MHANHELAVVDDRPYFETALCHGVQRAIISLSRLEAMAGEAPKGIVQIAAVFGSQYLRPEIELARQRIVNLASLYLLEASGGNLDVAAKLIRDQTFLSLSRGGSGLLKALFALPEYPMFGETVKGKVEDFLDAWSLKSGVEDYRNELVLRQENFLEISAAIWFADELELKVSDLHEELVEAAAVIRTALFVRAYSQDGTGLQGQLDFANLLANLRKQSSINWHNALNDVDLSDVSDKFSGVIHRIQSEMFTQDLPLLASKAMSLDRLVFALKERYYLGDSALEDTSAYDNLVSQEWARKTQGQTDVYSLMTIFVCLSAGAHAKTSLTERTAKSIIKQLRTEGFKPELASAWIKSHAPHEKQVDLLVEWEDFVDDAEQYLCDKWDDGYANALRFLAQHCHISKAVKK